MSEIVNGNDSTRRGLWAIIACAFLWSIGGLLIKWVNLHPLAVAGARSLIAALFGDTPISGKGDAEAPPKKGAVLFIQAGST
jgi:drug/metabolite transporter (DMT)-like permease